MDTDTYAFEVGTFECVAVSDGTFAYPEPAAFLFGNAPKERLKEALRRHGLQPEEWAQWASPYTCLVINTGEQHVLVDTGAGDLAPTTGNLRCNLQAIGIEAEDIDAVILTHGHPDHIGGTTDTDGKLAFPHARYVMSKDEWDFWASAPSLDALMVDQHLKELLLMVAQNKLSPTQGQLDLVDYGTEIVPGVRAVGAPGHTPGHMAIAISAGGEQLLYTSDAALHPIHLEHPDWSPQVDLAPQQGVGSRRELFERAAADKALMLAFHFPFPGLGRVIEKAEGWRWEPVQTTG
jgi:glyoxylase-like metal-dependent hydrolase (beta-lactamase superfamily II)